MAGNVMYARAIDRYPLLPTTLAHLAFAQLSVSAASDLWVTTRLAFSTAGIAHWSSTPTPDSGYFVAMTGGGSILSGVTLLNGAVWQDITLASTENQATPTPVAHKWFTLEQRHHNNVSRYGAVQCVNDWNGNAFNKNITAINIGQWNALNVVVDPTSGRFYDVYIDRVWIGTTRRGHDILKEEWDTGDFSNWGFHNAWDDTFGTGCKIIPDPGYSSFNYVCDAFGENGLRSAPLRVPVNNVGIPIPRG
jgi:hypothetical protein